MHVGLVHHTHHPACALLPRAAAYRLQYVTYDYQAPACSKKVATGGRCVPITGLCRHVVGLLSNALVGGRAQAAVLMLRLTTHPHHWHFACPRTVLLPEAT
jgi:hypothetical protein